MSKVMGQMDAVLAEGRARFLDSGIRLPEADNSSGYLGALRTGHVHSLGYARENQNDLEKKKARKARYERRRERRENGETEVS